MNGFGAIFATDETLGIGKNGDLPWHLPPDMAYFRDVTTGDGHNAVIMGRLTYESIPPRYRPLPNRKNVVLTSRTDYVVEGAEVMHDLQTALDTLEADPTVADIWVVGGGQVYAQALVHPACTEVHWTEIQGDFECDVRVTEFRDKFEVVSESAEHVHKGTHFIFKVLRPR